MESPLPDTAGDLAREALRISGSRYRRLFETARDGILLLDADTFRIEDVNPYLIELLGYSHAEFLGKKLWEAGPFADRAECKEMFVELQAKGYVRYEELPLRAKSGARVDVEFVSNAYVCEGIKVIHCNIRNITGRKAAELELKRSRQNLSRLAEASLRIMRETDLEPMLQVISSSALELTGARVAAAGHGYVSGQFVLGAAARAPGIPECPPGRMFVIEKGGVYMELLEGTADSIRLSDEQMRAHPAWWGLPQGHVPMRGLLGARLVNRQGRTNGMILATDKEQGDFTAEDEFLLRHLGTLASLASQHVEARVSLEEADRAKNEFLAMLSHELRNPLAPVTNSLFILERVAPGSEEARRAQKVIGRQVAHLTLLVNELLDVTRISRGKIRLQRASLDFTEVVRQAVEDHRALFAANSLELHASIPDEKIRINADRTRVAQVIGNLLANAAKFTQPGGKVTVSVQNNHRMGQAIARVRDTGAGIAPELLARIFEPFTQAHTTLDRSRGGLGLGLALVKGVMEMHGGTVSVESEGPGKGAEFALYFPLEAALPPPMSQGIVERQPA
jgi:PAS domain S-box-containing protein